LSATDVSEPAKRGRASIQQVGQNRGRSGHHRRSQGGLQCQMSSALHQRRGERGEHFEQVPLEFRARRQRGRHCEYFSREFNSLGNSPTSGMSFDRIY